MRLSGFVLILPLLLAWPAHASSPGQIGPDFACPRPPPVDGLSQAICDDPAMSRAEMVFEQAYYALRQAEGHGSWKALKSEAVSFNTQLRSECGIPQAGAADQTQPAGSAECYIRVTGRQRDEWLGRLSGSAHDEATRPLEEHIALQRQLVDLGYLPADTPADGIYGEATRRAISPWQQTATRPEQDGFISNAEVNVLMRSSRAAGAPEPADSGELLLCRKPQVTA